MTISTPDHRIAQEVSDFIRDAHAHRYSIHSTGLIGDIPDDIAESVKNSGYFEWDKRDSTANYLYIAKGEYTP